MSAEYIISATRGRVAVVPGKHWCHHCWEPFDTQLKMLEHLDEKHGSRYGGGLAAEHLRRKECEEQH